MLVQPPAALGARTSVRVHASDRFVGMFVIDGRLIWKDASRIDTARPRSRVKHCLLRTIFCIP